MEFEDYNKKYIYITNNINIENSGEIIQTSELKHYLIQSLRLEGKDYFDSLKAYSVDFDITCKLSIRDSIYNNIVDSGYEDQDEIVDLDGEELIQAQKLVDTWIKKQGMSALSFYIEDEIEIDLDKIKQTILYPNDFVSGIDMNIKINLNDLIPVWVNKSEIYTHTFYSYNILKNKYILITETTEEDNCIKFRLAESYCEMNIEHYKDYNIFDDIFLGACEINDTNIYNFNLGDDDSRVISFKYISINNHKDDYIESAKEIIGLNGACRSVVCDLCPFNITNINGGCFQFRKESKIGVNEYAVYKEDTRLVKWLNEYINEFTKN